MQEPSLCVCCSTVPIRERGSRVSSDAHGMAPSAARVTHRPHLPVAVEVEQVPVLPLHFGPAPRRAVCERECECASEGARLQHGTKARSEAVAAPGLRRGPYQSTLT
jgi:hypothetical protein